MVVGDPTDAATTEIGPLITPGEVDRVHQWVEGAKAGGGQVLCGGEKLTDTALQADSDSGPARGFQGRHGRNLRTCNLCLSYDDMEEAIERANSLPFSFQAAVFGQDIDVLMRVSSRLDARRSWSMTIPLSA